MKHKKIGITGGSGFIGRHLVETLAAADRDYIVRILDKRDPKFSGEFGFIKGDIRDADAVSEFCSGLDAVVHLAAEHHDFGVPEEEFYSVNEKGTQILLDGMSAANVNHIIFCSTVAVYDYDNSGPIDESTEPNPLSPYGRSKLAAERLIENWVQRSERRAQIFRPTVVIGPRNIANMYSLIDQIDRGRYLFHFGSGQNIKSLAVVMNLVQFAEFLLARDSGENTCSVFNFVDYPQMKVEETIEVIHEELGRKMPALRIPLSLALLGGRFFDLLIMLTGKNLPISSARIRKLATSTQFEGKKIDGTGFSRPFSPRQGTSEMVRWYRQHQNESHQ